MIFCNYNSGQQLLQIEGAFINSNQSRISTNRERVITDWGNYYKSGHNSNHFLRK